MTRENHSKSSHYFESNYDTKERFCSYWHQIDEILSQKPGKVLEIGVGNGFVSRYLKEKGLNILTMDLKYDLKPDVAGSVLSLPFGEKSFDVVACFEVLEHLLYSQFVPVLIEIGRVCRGRVILSLPDVATTYRFHVELPRGIVIKKLVPHPRPRIGAHVYDGEHYWEIGRKDYPLGRIKADILRAGYKVAETYRVFENYYHRFFILGKT